MVEHLFYANVPETLALLRVLLGNRASPPAGYTPVRAGADVDWQLLATGNLSASDKAAVYIAHGLAILEGRGGRFELHVRDQILAAVQTIVEVP
ncbi:MAG: hypothetical protein JO057_28730 [Chloroflexi bacterium]|nr:hypothetical protein [Chloroflexota bacterium]